MKYKIGIDIGATTIKVALLKNKQVLGKKQIQTPTKKDEFFEILRESIKDLSKNLRISNIGIGVPGPLNAKGDLILNPPNIKCLWNCPLAKIIEKDLKIKTKMDNDANCFTLGEAVMGAGKGAEVVVGITLGSGVGGGIVIKGKIYRGVFGSAGEVGHLTMKFDGPKCGCGSFGCLEAYCSQNFFIKRGLKPIQFLERAKRGDQKALAVFKEYGRYLGIGLSNVINLLDPEVIVIGGGIAGAYNFFIKETKKEIKKRVVFKPLNIIDS